MDDFTRSQRYSLACEKCFLPKLQPKLTARGEGWADVKTRCLLESIHLPFLRAFTPQSMKTSPSHSSFNRLITTLVNLSQPFLWWLAGLFACTVSIELSKSTPCSAHRVRFPLVGMGVLKSSLISLKMLFSDGGKGTSSLTEKLKSCACPSPG